ncbi:MAG: 2-oxoglutarate dehydrogenase complex dihydrolipoyllysine-residue succinyltransferase [Lentimicrobium sp.]
MIVEVKIPSPGESITSVVLAEWLVKNDEIVEKDQEILEIDSDKATLSLNAPESGKIKILIPEGQTVEVGTSVAQIDTDIVVIKEEDQTPTPLSSQTQEAPIPSVNEKPPASPYAAVSFKPQETKIQDEPQLNISPLARLLMKENYITEEEFLNFFRHYRISKEDVEFYLEERNKNKTDFSTTEIKLGAKINPSRETHREKMSTLRKKLAERLVAVKNETAMLTTFNEIDMSAVIGIRNQYKEAFQKKHNISLGFMSFFSKASSIALQHFPQVNAMLDGDEIVFHDYTDIGIAVSTPRGLMVPVLRDVESMSLAEIEIKLKDLANRARDKKILPDELSGATFTITNGGVFGSLFSTPIINPPQSAILGMHNIVERPMAISGKVEIRPMMYVALSYDHRLIDGQEAVSFLLMIKNLIENPIQMLTNGANPEKMLLEL